MIPMASRSMIVASMLRFGKNRPTANGSVGPTSGIQIYLRRLPLPPRPALRRGNRCERGGIKLERSDSLTKTSVHADYCIQQSDGRPGSKSAKLRAFPHHL